MKSKWLISLGLVVCLVAAFALPMCAPAPPPEEEVVPPEEEEAPPVEEWEWPKSLIVGTAEIGTSNHAVASAVGGVLEEKTGMRVRIIPESSTVVQMRMISTGGWDMLSLIPENVYDYTTGLEEFSFVQIRLVQTLWSSKVGVYAPAVRGTSDIYSFRDLATKKGLRIGLIVGQAMHETLAYKVFPALAGVTEEWAKENWIFIMTPGYTQGIKMLGEGKLDLVPSINPESSVSYEVAGSAAGLRWLDMDHENEEVWDVMAKYVPTRGKAIIESGVESAHGVEGMFGAVCYYVSDFTDEELQYQLAKWFGENYDIYKDVHKGCLWMQVKKFRELLDASPLPIAPGTVRYLKEIGMWTAADDEWYKQREELVMKYVEASAAALSEAKAKGIKISFDSKEWQDLWAVYKADLPRLEARPK